MSKQRVSAEEKRSRILQIFYEKKEFFDLKELEKIAPKEKGVNGKLVKDIVSNLVDDGLIDSAKIGTSTYYWSFPSKALNSRKRKLKELTAEFENASKRLKISEESLESAKAGENNTEERDKYLEKITDLRLEYDLLQMELKKYEDNDPEVLKKIKAASEDLKTAANRWTDNIFNIKSWCKRKFGYEDSHLDKHFGIPSEFDYVE